MTFVVSFLLTLLETPFDFSSMSASDMLFPQGLVVPVASHLGPNTTRCVIFSSYFSDSIFDGAVVASQWSFDL